MSRTRFSLFAMFLFVAVLALFSTAPPLAAQVTGTDVSYVKAGDTDDTGVLPATELKSITTFHEIALLEFQRGIVIAVPKDQGEAFAATYGNPAAIITFTWSSGGTPISMEVRQQAGESGTKFAQRAAKLKEDVQKVFPPDPPAEAMLAPRLELVPPALIPLVRFQRRLVA